ncbi:MAG TPA: LytR C-terminal domain-containing protein [Marmoricola sp.]
MARRFVERDERGVVAPSRVMLIAVVAVAIAGAAFIATSPQPKQAAQVVASETTPSASPTPTPPPSPTPTATPTKKPPKKKKVVVERGDTIVVVFNNSGVTGLASRTSGTAQGAGWNVVGSDNWYGTIPATTVYYPERLHAAAKVLARDLGIRRIKPAIDPMQGDRLTVILTTDYAS